MCNSGYFISTRASARLGIFRDLQLERLSDSADPLGSRAGSPFRPSPVKGPGLGLLDPVGTWVPYELERSRAGSPFSPRAVSSPRLLRVGCPAGFRREGGRPAVTIGGCQLQGPGATLRLEEIEAIDVGEVPAQRRLVHAADAVVTVRAKASHAAWVAQLAARQR
jgi:hypothetical protein